MQTHNLGYPRIGNQRELSTAVESYWSGKASIEELSAVGQSIRVQNWKLQQAAGIDLVPVGDFSFYDQVLDTSLMAGAVPERFQTLVGYERMFADHGQTSVGHEQMSACHELDLLFAMARGYSDIVPMATAKWFDTNYHYIVPEFTASQAFRVGSKKILNEYLEAKAAGINAKPVLLGPVSYLLLGKEKEAGFHRLELLPGLLPAYFEIIDELVKAGARYIQLDEPCLSLDLTDVERGAYTETYNAFNTLFPDTHILLASYFECYGENLSMVLTLPVGTIHLDLVCCSMQLEDILETSFAETSTTKLSLGVVDGRNIWKNDFQQSMHLIKKAADRFGNDRLWIAPSCSLLHCPCDLDLESGLEPALKEWMAFAKQKIHEVAALRILALHQFSPWTDRLWQDNIAALNSRRTSSLVHQPAVKMRVAGIIEKDASRQSSLKLLRDRQPETIGLDGLIPDEFERHNKLGYIVRRLEGFTFTDNGWIQSHGSNCVKPPILFGDVFRPADTPAGESDFAQTSPLYILQRSFVRNDQTRKETCTQIALAIRDEIAALEKAGIRVKPIDEPAIREGLPLRKENWEEYFNWAVRAFRICTSAAGLVEQFADSALIHPS